MLRVQALAYVHFEDETIGKMSMKHLSRDEARRIAGNIAKLPELLTPARVGKSGFRRLIISFAQR